MLMAFLGLTGFVFFFFVLFLSLMVSRASDQKTAFATRTIAQILGIYLILDYAVILTLYVAALFFSWDPLNIVGKSVEPAAKVFGGLLIMGLSFVGLISTIFILWAVRKSKKNENNPRNAS